MKNKIKANLNKAWIFIKRYWYLFLAGLVLILSILFLRKSSVENLYQSLMQKYRDSLEEGREDLEEVSEIRKTEQETQQELDRAYRQTIQELERVHDIKSEKISQQQQENIRKIIIDTNGSPEEMARLVQQTLGLPIK